MESVARMERSAGNTASAPRVSLRYTRATATGESSKASAAGWVRQGKLPDPVFPVLDNDSFQGQSAFLAQQDFHDSLCCLAIPFLRNPARRYMAG